MTVFPWEVRSAVDSTFLQAELADDRFLSKQKSQYVTAARYIPAPECSVQTEHSGTGMQWPAAATPILICSLIFEQSMVDIPAAKCTIR